MRTFARCVLVGLLVLSVVACSKPGDSESAPANSDSASSASSSSPASGPVAVGWPASAAISPASAVIAAASAPVSLREDIKLSQAPVYNASIEPQLAPGDREHPVVTLRAGSLTRLKFGIAPRWGVSVLAGTPATKIIESSKESVSLTVMVSCTVCRAQSSALKHITYQKSEGRSDVAEFEILRRIRTNGRDQGRIEFSVFDSESLQEYDHLVVPVIVAVGGADLSASDARPTSFDKSDVPPITGKEADVVMFVTGEADQRLGIEVHVALPELRSELGALPFNEDGKTPRKFVSDVLTVNGLKQFTKPGYDSISELTLQVPELAKLLKTQAGGTGLFAGKPWIDLKFSTADSTVATKKFFELGKLLHMVLFSDGEKTGTLAKIVSKMEAYVAPSGRPLRLEIVTNGPMLPWQYLHPLAPIARPGDFWGLKFSLSVARQDIGSTHALRAAQSRPHAIVFAEYGDKTDPSRSFADQEVDALRKLSGFKVTPFQSGKTFLEDGLKANRSDVAAIVTFLHATAGEFVVNAGSVGVDQTDAVGPAMHFNTADLVRGTDIMYLKTDLDESMQSQPYLISRPLVILNACETGPSTFSAEQVTIPDAFFRMGAQGVLVTETQVWDKLADAVGARLIIKLGRGETVSDAMTEIRRELYAEGKNPLGLLYAYYGNPAATLAEQSQ